MSRVCQITGVKAKTGHKIHRSGLAKKKGGIGRHITKRVKRVIRPNIRKKRVYVPELDQWIKLTITAKALKTIDKNGAYKTLLKAGLIKPVKAEATKKPTLAAN